jgi:hypothetical protein
VPELELLKQADFILSQCGRPTAPQGLSAVFFERKFLIQAVVATATTKTFIKEVTGDTTWELRSIQGTVAAGQKLYLQVQMPDGRFLMNTLMDTVEFLGYGSWRYCLNRPVECPPGTKIQVTLDTNIPAAVSSQPESLCFDGAYRYYLKGSQKGPCVDVASLMPELKGHANQNILAPCWMQGEYPINPCGGDEDEFQYHSNSLQLSVTGATLTGQVQAQIDPQYDFACRRILANVQADSTVTAGEWLVRARTGNGYALMDDYIDLAYYLGSAPMPGHDWNIRAGDNVFFDLLLADAAGTGNMSIVLVLDGVRRPRRV